MDGRSSTAEPKHSYHHPASFTRLNPDAASLGHQTIPHTASLSTHLEFLPVLFPSQTVYQAQLQAQLLHYNQLVAPGRGRGGGGPQSSTLSNLVSNNSNFNAGSRSRSSSKVSNKDVPASKPSGNPSCHGNRGSKNTDKAERAVIAGKESATPAAAPAVAAAVAPAATPAAAAAAASAAPAPPNMPSSKQTETLSHPLPTRPGRPQTQSHNHPQHSHQQTSPRAPAQASSVPSTPHQHARNFSFESREPSPNATQNHSPRSTYSDPNGNLTSLRPLPPRLGGCVYETALVRSRRRMPYNIGGDRLEPVEPSKIKSKLSEDEERKLTTDMRELYDRLKPTDKVKGNREKLVKKLEKIFNDEWPNRDIKVNLFGSSGNKLCSDDSDLDICITTDWKELENVCMIAELLGNRGMDKVVCVSSAKVPIVKMWDPELGLACDINVNNTLALENTRMVLTYVDIDERVRPLAMIIKHWTRRRIINDAAFGGTLSSYTWICMIIAFLQLRDPPVLPALHQSSHRLSSSTKGQKSEFADDLSKLRGFGDKNKETLGELLFNFFKFYAHTFDYDKWALSIRLGRKLTKTEKKWHLALNNALCVEEPFNTMRNLGNTADDTSFRGLHLELRRAFDLIASAKLEDCCEHYVFPKEEERVWQKPAPAPRPVLVRSSSQQHSNRGGRGNYRGSRGHRGNNRRASSSVTYENNPVLVQPGLPVPPGVGVGADGTWYLTPGAAHVAQVAAATQQAQAHAQAQYAYVSPEMFNQAAAGYSLAAFDHPSLRFQVFTQSQHYAHQQAMANMHRLNNTNAATSNSNANLGSSSQATDRSRAGSFDQPPLSAPLRAAPEFAYMYPQMPLASQYFAAQNGFTTYPSSPSTATAAAAPEFRRSLHRNTVTGEPGSSVSNATMRSQSQPASRSPMPATTTQGGVSGYPTSSQAAATSNGIPAMVNGMGISMGGDLAGTVASHAHYNSNSSIPAYQTRQVNGMPISFMPSEDAVDADLDDGNTRSLPDSPPDENLTGYVGYYISDGTSPMKKTLPNGIPAFGDLHQSPHARRRLSTDQTPQSILDRRMKRTSRSPSPLGSGANHARAFSVGGACSAPVGSTATFPQYGAGTSKLSVEARPLVVNGSVSKPMVSPANSSRQPSASLESTSPETTGSGGSGGSGGSISFDNALHIAHGLGVTNGISRPSPDKQTSSTLEPSQLAQPDAREQQRPVVVNGSSTPSTAPPMVVGSSALHNAVPDAKSFNQRINAKAWFTSTPPSSIQQRMSVMGSDSTIAGVGGVGGMTPYQMSPAARHRVMSRQQQQNGVIAPLDLAITDHTILPEFHLSPVYENRTPSPTAIRRFDTPSSASAAAPPTFFPSGVGGTGERYAGPTVTSLSKDLQQATKALKPKAISQQQDPGVKQEQPASTWANGLITKESIGGGAGSGSSRPQPARADTASSNNSGSGSWQKAKAKKKPTDLKNLTNGFPQSEQAPKNEADRKGG